MKTLQEIAKELGIDNLVIDSYFKKFDNKPFLTLVKSEYLKHNGCTIIYFDYKCDDKSDICSLMTGRYKATIQNNEIYDIEPFSKNIILDHSYLMQNK